MTPEERYFNFMKNYNDKLRQQNTDWLEPQDLGDVLMETAEQNEPGCIAKILTDIQSGKIS